MDTAYRYLTNGRVMNGRVYDLYTEISPHAENSDTLISRVKLNGYRYARLIKLKKVWQVWVAN